MNTNVKKLMLWIIALALLSGGALLAQSQNVTGTWQGTLHAGRGDLRIVIKISRADDESLKAAMYSIDQGGQPIGASAITLQGSTIKISIAAIGGTYEGTLNAARIRSREHGRRGQSPLP